MLAPLPPRVITTFCFLTRSITHNASAIERLKRPSRGGQNLTERYRRLEKSLRSKESLSKGIDGLERSQVVDSALLDTNGVEATQSITRTDVAGGKEGPKMFRGFLIPEKPKEPESDECCMSGCAICVYDLYQDSLNTYNDSLASLRATFRTQNVSESEWPVSLQASPKIVENKTKDVVMSVFEEMEKRLKEKRV